MPHRLDTIGRMTGESCCIVFLALRQASDPCATRWRTPALGYDCALERLELLGCDRFRIEQRLGVGDLLGRGCARDVPDVGVLGLFDLMEGGRGPFGRALVSARRGGNRTPRGLLLRRFEPRNAFGIPVRVSW
ncbi:hypothetical protein [Rhodococcus sp. ACPA1]|uniref:hypothetical protein n=1 Tax=Rhodococcus sp. ACPA1 TaxID=2028572 RepID=UPI001C52DDB6|nr:hypothetical protein [Rhodococcus sp. ACPA1]